MRFLRAPFHHHRHWALALIALALGMKALVPTGFMLDSGARGLTITICSGQGNDTARIILPSVGKVHDDRGQTGHAPDACPYAGLAMAGLAGIDVPLLTLLIAFILALGFAPTVNPSPARRAFLRPPLRGPPALG